LKNIADRDAIMDSARNLADSNFNPISIVPDLSQRQRKDEERLREGKQKWKEKRLRTGNGFLLVQGGKENDIKEGVRPRQEKHIPWRELGMGSCWYKGERRMI